MQLKVLATCQGRIDNISDTACLMHALQATVGPDMVAGKQM